jgi:membrane protease subunit HflC
MARLSISTIVIIVLLIVLAMGCLYTVDMTEQVVITYFGKPKAVVKDPGLHLKVPFLWKVNRFEKRMMEWDGSADQIPTKDKKFIWVDTFARWRIVDPLKYFQAVRTERQAQTRLDDIIDGSTRDFVTENILIEVVRNSNRELVQTETGIQLDKEIVAIKIGRKVITRRILEKAKQLMPQFGIELIDVQIKRINYVEEVRVKVYERMISERMRIAGLIRAEGKKNFEDIEGQKNKELQRIESGAYEKAETIRGKADAEATKIYARAFNRDPEFYSFIRSLESYKSSLKENSIAILTTDNDYLRYLKSKSPR